MRRRSKAGGKSPNAQAPKAAARKSRIAPKAGHPRTTSTTKLETEVARLARERDEAVQQQTATAEVLKVISGSAFDLQTVLDTLAGSAKRLCEADAAAIWRPDGGTFKVAAGYSTSAEWLEYAKQNPVVPDRGTVLGRVALEGRNIHIHDVLADPEFTGFGYYSRGNYRTSLGVPLLRKGEIIGVFVIVRSQVKPFTEKQIELVTTFADQAVIAIENARLLNELRGRTADLTESLQQQTATADVLKVISRSTFDLQVVLEELVESAAKLCDADIATIWRPEGQAYRVAATYQTTVAHKEYLANLPIKPDRGSCVGRTLLEAKIVQIPDIREDPEYALELKKQGKLSGYRTMLGVPLLREGIPIGVIALVRSTVRPFTPGQIELVKTFADQALIAIENTRLFEAEQQRSRELAESLEQQTATSEVLQVISRSAFDLEAVLNTLVESASRVCEADRGVILRPTGESASYHSAASYGHTPEYDEYIKTLTFTPGRDTLTGRVLLAGKSVQIADVLADAEWAHAHPGAARLGNFRTMLGVPLLRERTPIGIFLLQRAEVRPFTENQIKLVETFADQAVIAIENTRLFEAEQRRTRELTESLEQQTATSEVLQVISSSPGELEPVFDSMLANATKLCEATHANVWRFDGQQLHIAAVRGDSSFVEWLRRHSPLPPMAGSAANRIVRGERIVHVADRREEEAYRTNATFREMVDRSGVRGSLSVALRKDETLLGMINVYRQEVRPFSDKQITLLENFAAQAVIAIENARLLNELRQRTDDLSKRTTDLSEALEQQTATSEVLTVISSSPGELEPVFQVILENAVRLCEAKFGVLFLSEGDAFRTVALQGAPAAYAEARRREPVIHPGLGTSIGRASSTRQPVQIADIRAEPAYINEPQRFAVLDLAGARTMLNVPMLKEDALVGMVSIYRQEVRPFTDKQIGLVKNFAAQAVIAVENTRLLNELRKRTDELGRSVEELRALGEISQAVNSTLDLQNVLETIVAKAVQLSGTEAGAIYVFNDQQREFHLRATYGMDPELIEALTQRHIGLDEPNITPTFLAGEPIQVPDLREAVSSAANDIVLRAGFRALLIAPLLRGEDIVGMLVVRRRTPGTFPQNTIQLIKTFAAQSAVAIENARLFQSVQTSLEDLRTTQDRLVQTQKLASLGQLTAGIAHEIKNPLNFVNNFSGVSVELIDELQQTLPRVTANANTLAEITELTDTLRDNLGKIVQHGKRADSIVKNMLLHSREGSGEHRPVDINALVEEAVNLAYHGARAEKQGFNVTLERSLDLAAGEVDCFPQEITRVLLNLISNGFYAATRRKGQTKDDNFEPKLVATTRSLGDRVEIRIRDNGTGISPEVKEKIFNPFFTTKPAGEGTGLGLSISHDIIVKQHAGSIEVDTQLGEFTEVRIVVPRVSAFVAAGQA